MAVMAMAERLSRDEDVMGLDAPTLHHLWECSEVHQCLGCLGASAGTGKPEPAPGCLTGHAWVRWFRFI